jgi:hypothetical protein
MGNIGSYQDITSRGPGASSEIGLLSQLPTPRAFDAAAIKRAASSRPFLSSRPSAQSNTIVPQSGLFLPDYWIEGLFWIPMANRWRKERINRRGIGWSVDR